MLDTKIKVIAIATLMTSSLAAPLLASEENNDNIKERKENVKNFNRVLLRDILKNVLKEGSVSDSKDFSKLLKKAFKEIQDLEMDKDDLKQELIPFMQDVVDPQRMYSGKKMYTKKRAYTPGADSLKNDKNKKLYSKFIHNVYELTRGE